MPYHVGRDPAAEPSHRFLLALAIRDGDQARALEPARVHAFQQRVRERVERELAGFPAP